MSTTTHTATPFWRYRKLIQIHPDILLYIAYHYPYSYTILKVQNARSNTPWYTTIHHLPLPIQLHHSEGTERSFKYTLIYYYTSPTTTHTATPLWRYRELIQIHPDILLYIAYHYPYSYTTLKVQRAHSNTPWYTTIHRLPLPIQLHHSEGTESSFKYTLIYYYTSLTTTHTATPLWRYRELIQILTDILLYITYHYPYSYTTLKVQKARSIHPDILLYIAYHYPYSDITLKVQTDILLYIAYHYPYSYTTLKVQTDILLYIAYHYPYSYTTLKVQRARSNTHWYTTIHRLPLPIQLHHSEGTESSFKYTLTYYYTSPTTTHTATPLWRYR